MAEEPVGSGPLGFGKVRGWAEALRDLGSDGWRGLGKLLYYEGHWLPECALQRLGFPSVIVNHSGTYSVRSEKRKEGEMEGVPCFGVTYSHSE